MRGGPCLLLFRTFTTLIKFYLKKPLFVPYLYTQKTFVSHTGNHQVSDKGLTRSLQLILLHSSLFPFSFPTYCTVNDANAIWSADISGFR